MACTSVPWQRHGNWTCIVKQFGVPPLVIRRPCSRNHHNRCCVLALKDLRTVRVSELRHVAMASSRMFFAVVGQDGEHDSSSLWILHNVEASSSGNTAGILISIKHVMLALCFGSHASGTDQLLLPQPARSSWTSWPPKTRHTSASI
jgi:hypothetical protein